MSVYTPVDRAQLETFLRDYDIGDYVAHRGISEGISNTNYFLTTTRTEVVLTLFELIGFEDVPYYLDLMAWLAARGVPGANPVADRSGQYMKPLAGKPAALVHKLAGGGLHGTPSLAQCREIGRALAQLHLAGEGFAQRRDNDRGPRWCQSAAERVLPLLDRVEAHLLNDELAALTEHPRSRLPQGTIHADLFRDNALFDGDRLCGLIDFYYACTDALAFDVAEQVTATVTNPATGDDVQITLGGLQSSTLNVQAELHDMSGRVVSIQVLPVQSGQLITSLSLAPGLANGMYVASVTEGRSRWSARLVIARE